MCEGKAYYYLPTTWSGSCYAAYVVPAVRATTEHPNHPFSHLYRRTIVAGPVKQASASIPDYGMATVLDSIRELAREVERMDNATAKDIEELTAVLVAMHYKTEWL